MCWIHFSIGRHIRYFVEIRSIKSNAKRFWIFAEKDNVGNSVRTICKYNTGIFLRLRRKPSSCAIIWSILVNSDF